MSLSSASPATLLLATDVFGNTPAVAGLVRQLAVPTLVVSPFGGKPRSFRSEQEAYQAFLAEGGVAAYAQLLHAALLQQPELRFAIGFSAGASALWLNSPDDVMANVLQTVLFYGSRIRDHRTLQPQSPVRLIFAQQEAAFDAAELTQDLRARGHQAELASGTRHGFMNSYSRGSNIAAQTRYMTQLISLLQQGKRKFNPREAHCCTA